ncbi:CsbD family protein [Plantactinospora sp. KBS50]|uniref:CsbD family protein n=1 Tax=Plantactinospora sp. KBS50 TaxID=2024580 RepID=UPI000BAB0657|nr:CsbD family protein [Plantactinospora sp. KBS50]ASW55074.1 general stress protein CsbD [Plantactinospora sp. KBS50]
MSFADKVSNKFEELKGAAKQKYGDATDNESVEAEGATERTEAQAKQAGEHLKDAGRDARDALGG